MSYVIVCRALTGRLLTREGRPPPIGQFLKSYDPEGGNGYGVAEWTADPAQAQRFPDAGAAWRCWVTVPKSRPVRADGEPNKPLTAFTVDMVPMGGGRDG